MICVDSLEVGDFIECVECREEWGLTKGKQYKVCVKKFTNESDRTHILIIKDDGTNWFRINAGGSRRRSFTKAIILPKDGGYWR